MPRRLIGIQYNNGIAQKNRINEGQIQPRFQVQIPLPTTGNPGEVKRDPNSYTTTTMTI